MEWGTLPVRTTHPREGVDRKLVDRHDLPVLSAEQEVMGETEDGYDAILDYSYIVMRNGDILYHGNDAGVASNVLNQIGARDRLNPT